MRFIQTDDQPVTLDMLREAVCDDDPDCAVASDGLLSRSGEKLGVIRLKQSGDGQFDDEVRVLRQAVEAASGTGKRKVLKTLGEARAIVSVEVLWEDREPEETLQKIDPLWRWLFSNRTGLVQADDEGYYERSRRILAVE
jgi:hypothetical protein